MLAGVRLYFASPTNTHRPLSHQERSGSSRILPAPIEPEPAALGSLWEGAFRETERLPQRDNQKVLEDLGHVQKEAACSYLGWPKLDGKAAEDQASQLCGNSVVHGQAGVPHCWDRMGRITDPGHLPEKGAQRTEEPTDAAPSPGSASSRSVAASSRRFISTSAV